MKYIITFLLLCGLAFGQHIKASQADVGTLNVTGTGVIHTLTVGQTNQDVNLDGTTYATLSAALAALPSGGTLRVGAGTYTISATTSFVSNLDIECSPNNQSIFQASAGLNSVMFLANGVNNVRVSGCVFDGNKGSNSNQFALFELQAVNRADIIGNHFQNNKSRLLWVEHGNTNIRIDRNEFDHYGQPLPASIGNEGIVVAPASSGTGNSAVQISNNFVHDGNLGITSYSSSNTANISQDIEISGNFVFSNANDGILLYSPNQSGAIQRNYRFINNWSYCNGWPANGTGFSSNCTAGFLQNGSTASSSGVGINLGSPLMDQPQLIGNRTHDNFYEGIDVVAQTATLVNCAGSTTVTYVSGDPFNTAWKANQGVKINGTFYNIASVAGATSTLTLTGTCANGSSLGFTGIGYSRATVVGNYAWNNGHGNSSNSGHGFADSGYGDTWSGNVSYNNNALGFIDSLSAFVTHTGDKAYNNEVGGGSSNAFVCQQCLNPSYVNVSADDSNAVQVQTIGVTISGGTNNAYVCSPSLGGGGTSISDSGTNTTFCKMLNGTASLGTGGISSGNCAAAVTVSAPGVTTSDVIGFSLNGTATGYTGATGSGLHILAVPTANNVNFYVCNPTAGSITPGSATLNWKVR